MSTSSVRVKVMWTPDGDYVEGELVYPLGDDDGEGLQKYLSTQGPRIVWVAKNLKWSRPASLAFAICAGRVDTTQGSAPEPV